MATHYHNASVSSHSDFAEFVEQRRLAYEDDCQISVTCQAFGPDCKSDFDMYGGVVLMFFLVAYTFKILGFICDRHLTAIVQKIVDKLKIPEDVAGATFMAMSSSAPEVILTIITTFVAPSSAGAACVAGSALFNLLIIVGVLPLVSSTGPLKMGWYVTYRDCLYYGLSVIALFVFCLDSKVEWWEALLMNAVYGTYVIYLAFYNKKAIEHYGLHLPNDIQGTRMFTNGDNIRYPDFCKSLSKEKLDEKELQMRWCSMKKVDWKSEEELDEWFKVRLLKCFDIEDGPAGPVKSYPAILKPEVIGLDSVGMEIVPGGGKQNEQNDDPFRTETKSKIADLEVKVKDMDNRMRKYTSAGALATMAAQSLGKRKAAMLESLKALREDAGEDMDDENDDGPLTKNDPGLIIINKTVPPYDRFILGFFVVLIWVAMFTYLMADGATRFGCTTNIPAFPMGLIFLAAGTSVPDLVASMSVARQGFADMAAANAVGGNTFKNFVGLGLPWFFAALIQGPVEVPAGEMAEACALMGLTLIAYLVAIRMNNWVLNKTIGGYMILMYSLSMIFSLVRHYTYYVHQTEE